MRRHMRICTALVAVMVMLAWTPSVWAYRDWDETPVEVDALIVRPLALAATIASSIGYLFFVLPWAAMTDTVDETAEVMVNEPYRFTFERPLGYPTHQYRDNGW